MPISKQKSMKKILQGLTTIGVIGRMKEILNYDYKNKYACMNQSDIAPINNVNNSWNRNLELKEYSSKYAFSFCSKNEK